VNEKNDEGSFLDPLEEVSYPTAKETIGSEQESMISFHYYQQCLDLDLNRYETSVVEDDQQGFIPNLQSGDNRAEFCYSEESVGFCYFVEPVMY